VPTAPEDSAIDVTISKIEQCVSMLDDIYNTLADLEEIDVETDTTISMIYNNIDDLYAKVDQKYDIEPIDIDAEDDDGDTSVSEDYALSEILNKNSSAEEYIDDFIKSDAPQFKDKSKEERVKMALGAYYAMKEDEDEEDDKPNKTNIAKWKQLAATGFISDNEAKLAQRALISIDSGRKLSIGELNVLANIAKTLLGVVLGDSSTFNRVKTSLK
jgi:hypothetical protein